MADSVSGAPLPYTTVGPAAVIRVGVVFRLVSDALAPQLPPALTATV